MSDSQEMESLEGLITSKFCKVMEVAGHQILFRYESAAFTFIKLAEINVPKLGRLTYRQTVDCDSAAEAERWLDGIDHLAARKTLNWFHKRLKKANG